MKDIMDVISSYWLKLLRNCDFPHMFCMYTDFVLVILASVKESFNQPYLVKTVLESKTVEKVSEEKNLGPGNQSKRIVASRLNGKK